MNTCGKVGGGGITPYDFAEITQRPYHSRKCKNDDELISMQRQLAPERWKQEFRTKGGDCTFCISVTGHSEWLPFPAGQITRTEPKMRDYFFLGALRPQGRGARLTQMCIVI